MTVAYPGFLAPGARSEIGAPFPDLFQKIFQNGRPKTNLGIFKSEKKIVSLVCHYFKYVILFCTVQKQTSSKIWFLIQGLDIYKVHLVDQIRVSLSAIEKWK